MAGDCCHPLEEMAHCGEYTHYVLHACIVTNAEINAICDKEFEKCRRRSTIHSLPLICWGDVLLVPSNITKFLLNGSTLHPPSYLAAEREEH